MRPLRPTTHSLWAMLYLAQLGVGVPTTARRLASDLHIPATITAKTLHGLSAAGLVHATRGKSGGVARARPVHEITLGEIVQAVDRPLRPPPCTLNRESCPVGDCIVRIYWGESQKALIDRLANVRLDQFADEVGNEGPF